MAHVTVPDVAPRAQFAVGSSSTGPFNFTFTFYDDADLKVYVGDNTTPLTLTTNYTVVGTPGTTGGYVGGALTLVTAVANTTVTVELDIPILRTTDFPTVGAFNITSLNTQLDKSFSILQQIDQKYSRTVRLPPVDGDIDVVLQPEADRADKVFVWNADAEPDSLTYAELAVEMGIVVAAANTAALAAQVAAELAEAHAETAETNAETAETNAEASEAAAAASAAAAAATFVAAGFPAPATASTLLVRNAGNTAYDAKTYAQLRTLLGATATGEAVFAAADAAAVRTAAGATATGSSLIVAADAAAVRTAAGATATGSSVITAASAAAGLSALGGQTLDAMLTAMAALTSADNKVLAFSGSDAPALTDFMRSAGSWTPGISSSGGAVTSGTVTAGGYYWKFGNLVIATFQYYNGTTSGGSGDLRFTGLPFTVLNDASSAANAMGFMMRVSNLNTGATPNTLSFQPINNQTYTNVVESFDNGASAATQIGAWAANSEVVGCLVYRSAT